MRIALAIFRDFGNIPYSKDRFIKFARGTLMALSNTFKSLWVHTLLGPVAFLRFRLLVIEKTLRIFYQFLQFCFLFLLVIVVKNLLK